jgi:cytochrome c oxidase cbb3-type subunit 3
LLAGAVVCPAYAQSVGVSPSTADFVKEAAISDMFEIQSSQIAVTQTSDPTKIFCIVFDSAAMRRLTRLAEPARLRGANNKRPADLGLELAARLAVSRRPWASAMQAFVGKDWKRRTSRAPGLLRAPWLGLLALGLASLGLSGCKREERELRLDPPIAAALDEIALMPIAIGGAPPQVYAAQGKPYEGNAYNLNQGKRAYGAFGCKDCHGDGSGGSGPSLLDGWWNYGPDIVSIVASIRDGRPGGMPAFRDRIVTEQIWQLAGYVQTLGSYSPPTGAPGRDDDRQTRPAENRAPATFAPLEPPGG